MFLRSLTTRGFKSFADRTTLEFTPGISVIVGPNGSGKSNIADAISWVLGEQGPRALRGSQMADVIFAGGPARQPLGLAEVTLVIDNQEMLSDAGLGRAQHAVVGQGQLEDVLSARPDERRQFIEEAAGIAKH